MRGQSERPPVAVSVRWELTVKLAGELVISDQRRLHAYVIARGGTVAHAVHGEQDQWTLRLPSNAPTAALALEIIVKALVAAVPADRIDNLLIHGIRRVP